MGSRGLWIPALCSVTLEALVGARLGAARARHPLAAKDAGRISVRYSLSLLAISVPLAVWTLASRASREAAAGAAHPSWTIAAAFVAVVVAATPVRWGLMLILGPRRR